MCLDLLKGIVCLSICLLTLFILPLLPLLCPQLLVCEQPARLSILIGIQSQMTVDCKCIHLKYWTINSAMNFSRCLVVSSYPSPLQSTLTPLIIMIAHPHTCPNAHPYMPRDITHTPTQMPNQRQGPVRGFQGFWIQISN